MAGRLGKGSWILGLLMLAAAAAGAFFFFRSAAEQQAQAQAPAPPAQPPAGVSSLGRIRPEDDPVVIGARSLSGQPSLVRKLNVKEGDYIKTGQIVAVLDSLAQLEAAQQQAEARIRVAEARIKQAQAGAKPADIAVQQAVISRLEVELASARTTLTRTDALFKSGVITRPVLEKDQLAVDSLAKQIAEAKERLGVFEIRQVDVDVEVASLRAAEADLQRAKVETEAATIRAPYSGLVLKIHAWQGQEIGPNGLLELAKVERMYVAAEIAESDVQRVRVGQRATIRGYSLPGPMEGQVDRLGLRVSRNSLVQDNPVNLTDARVSEVRIRLDDGAAVRNLIDAQVEVLIHP